MNSPKKIARTTGVLYLIIFFANMFAYFFVFLSLRVPGDAAATAQNIMASESLYRAGIVSYLVVFLSDIGVAVLLYRLLKPVSQSLSLAAMITRLIQTAVHGINLINFVFPLLLLSGSGYLAVFEVGQLQALASVFLDAHHYGTLISEAFFFASTAILAYLIYKSDYFPRILGVLMWGASLGYFLDSFAIFLLPNYETIIADNIVPLVVIGEMSFTLWLLIKGVKTPKEDSTISVDSAQAESIAA